MPGNPLTIPSNEDALFGQKGQSGTPGAPGVGPGGGFGGGGGFQPGAGGSGFFGAAPGYNRGLPDFGYRRKAFGSNPYAQMNLGIQKNRATTPYSFLGVNSLGMGQGSGQTNAPGGQVGGIQRQGYAQPMGSQGGGFGGGILQRLQGGGGLMGGMGQGAGGGYDPSNPWGAFTGDTREDFRGEQNRTFGRFGEAGTFDPMGNPAIMQAIQENYARQAGGRQAGIRNSLNAGGNADPNAYAYGALRGDLGLQSDMSGAMSQAQLAQLMNQQQFGQNMFSQWQGGEQNLVQGEQQHRFEPKPQSGWGQALGAIGGAAIGAIPFGKMFGGGGGGSMQQYNSPDYGWGGTGQR